MSHLPIHHNPLRTREELCLAMNQLLDPLAPYFSPGKARIIPGASGAGHDEDVAGLEGFSRLLWGLAPLIAGGGNCALLDGFTRGLANGTDPAHPEYWGEAGDNSQRIVEMAAIGLALALAPQQFWEPLSAKEKQQLVEWLSQANRYQVYDCNWLYFPVIVNLGLKAVDAPYDLALIRSNLDRLEAFTVGEGWYTDGPGAHADYYVPVALHYFNLLYAVQMEREDPQRAARFKDRATTFAHSFIHWFAEDGSALPYGRSLTYRFVQAAFWSAAVYAGIEPFPLGVIKGIVLRHLRYWFRQPIFQHDGTLSIGYGYPNLVMAENYNAPGSPYWAFKSFLLLALAEDHPFWRAEEQPLPTLAQPVVQPAPHLVLLRQGTQGHVLAFSSGHPAASGHTHGAAKYEKFVYSTFFGFSVPRGEWGLAQGAYDSMLALCEGEDSLYRIKRQSETLCLSERLIHTRWLPWPDVNVETWLVPGTPWHIRVHRISTNRRLGTAEGGFALGLRPQPASTGQRAARTAAADGGAVLTASPLPELLQDADSLLALAPWGASGIKALYGGSAAVAVYPNANTNLLHPRTLLPTLTGALEPGVHFLAAAVFGMASTREAEVAAAWAQAPGLEIADGCLVIYRGREGSGLPPANGTLAAPAASPQACLRIRFDG